MRRCIWSLSQGGLISGLPKFQVFKLSAHLEGVIFSSSFRAMFWSRRAPNMVIPLGAGHSCPYQVALFYFGPAFAPYDNFRTCFIDVGNFSLFLKSISPALQTSWVRVVGQTLITFPVVARPSPCPSLLRCSCRFPDCHCSVRLNFLPWKEDDCRRSPPCP